jgi:cell division cycle protein 20 (cofactor of APC complex)
MCCVWDKGMETARYTWRDSQAAVKALAWCPFEKNVLATGSGTADRHIRVCKCICTHVMYVHFITFIFSLDCTQFYNTSQGTLLNKVDTNSQVTALLWSKTEKELVSSHGFSQNQICVWKVSPVVGAACSVV